MQKSLLYSIIFVFFIKILFIIFELTYAIQLRENNVNPFIVIWKKKIEFIFKLLMLLMLIHIFYPFKNNLKSLTIYVKPFIFMFSILTLFSLFWSK
uniref:DUF5658 domain-containing protein n=1 Tax=viral metagenome TaxID=1070528 RepID=A0A6C0HRE2_9ZZZZ